MSPLDYLTYLVASVLLVAALVGQTIPWLAEAYPAAYRYDEPDWRPFAQAVFILAVVNAVVSLVSALV